MNLFYRNILFLFTGLLLLSGCTSRNPFSVKEDHNGLTIFENNQPVMHYQKIAVPESESQFRNNYIHPLYNINGEIITEDYPKDHPHHRGLFWAWHQILIGNNRIGDSWVYDNFINDIQEVTTAIKSNSIILKGKVEWKSPNWIDTSGTRLPFAKESFQWNLHPVQDNFRIIDFKFTLTSLVDSLRIGGADNVKAYGGFSCRIKLPDDIYFFGENNILIPQNEPVNAGAWLNMNGCIGGASKNGILIFSHPDNPEHPQPWILREKNSMQNVVYPGRNPINLMNNDSITLRYRLVLYNGDEYAISPQKMYQQYLSYEK